MRALIVLFSIMLVWIMIPSLSVAGERDRYEKHDGKSRVKNEYRVGHDHDRRHDRHDNGRWEKHRSRDERGHRHVVYREPARRIVYKPFMGPIVVREPVVYYPVSYVTIGGPNLSFRVTW